MREAIARRVWFGAGFDARLARALLTPFEWLYGGVSVLLGVTRARSAGATPVPTISIGNISVGGTGKTPMAAWVVDQLRQRGAVPAVLMRGYGGDEPLVHSVLNPRVPVYANPRRRDAAAEAIAHGATALVLDDGFQHRQMPRDADIVLVSADQWSDIPVRVLPAGPFRERLTSLRRASLIAVTRKAASLEQAAVVAARIRNAAPGVPVAVVSLAPDALHQWKSEARMAARALSGQRVLAIAGIGAPDAFWAQLRALGATVIPVSFGDHHAYTRDDVTHVMARAAECERVVCTLKDAVKLGSLWPADGPPLWYVSQSVVIESGLMELQTLLDRVVHRTRL